MHYIFFLSPHLDYWSKLQRLTSKFIWNGKPPCIKYSTLQCCKDASGLALTDFKLYHWTFTLQPLTVWLNPDSTVSWQLIEFNLALPYRLQDLIYCNILLKNVKQCFGPIITYLLSTWWATSEFSHNDHNWHSNSPLFCNHKLLSDNKPFVFSDWSDRGINVLADVLGDNGLQSFKDLRAKYNLPGIFSSFICAWDLPCAHMGSLGALVFHLTLRKLLTSYEGTRGMVSLLLISYKICQLRIQYGQTSNRFSLKILIISWFIWRWFIWCISLPGIIIY